VKPHPDLWRIPVIWCLGFGLELEVLRWIQVSIGLHFEVDLRCLGKRAGLEAAMINKVMRSASSCLISVTGCMLYVPFFSMKTVEDVLV
jgi:hypothetical protein